MRAGICVEMCVDMRVGMRVGMRAGMHVACRHGHRYVHIDRCIDICTDMCADTIRALLPHRVHTVQCKYGHLGIADGPGHLGIADGMSIARVWTCRKAVLLSTGTPIPAQCACRRRCRDRAKNA